MNKKANQNLIDHFLKLQDLPRISQESYLKAIARSEPGLAKQLKIMLEHLHQAERDGFLPTNPNHNPPLQIDKQLGPYLLKQLLGQGGMGTVFLASQQRPVKRPVALKLMHHGATPGQLLKRFELEKQVLASLDHSHITKLFDVGTTESGTPYFAMEYVNGLPLHQFWNHHPMPLASRLTLFVELCQAVQYAHQKGVIHRDLKPGNVLVKLEQGKPVPKIIDFGIAKLMFGNEPASALGTSMTGTPAYMSPEQLLGRHCVDTRSDIYALGVLLFQLLTGRTPYDINQPEKCLLDASREDLFFRPPAPSQWLSQQLQNSLKSNWQRLSGRNSTIGKDLDRICQKALAFEPHQRYATASALALDIQAYLNHQPISAAPNTKRYRFACFFKRHRWVSLAVSLAIGGVVMGLGATGFALVRERAAKAEIREAANAAVKAASQSKLAFQALQNLLAAPDPFQAGKDVRVSELLDRFPQLLQTTHMDNQTLAMLHQTIGKTYLHLGDFGQAQMHALWALEYSRCEPDQSEGVTLTSQLLLSRALGEQGQIKKAHRMAREVWQLCLHRYGQEAGLTLEAQINAFALYMEHRQFEEAVRVGEPLLQLLPTSAGYDGIGIVPFLGNFGQVYAYLRQFPEAMAYLEPAFHLNKTLYGEQHPQTLETMHNYVSLLVETNQINNATKLAETLLKHQELVRGFQHPYTLGALSLLGHAHLSAGMFEDAYACLRDLVSRGEAVFSANHPRLAYCRHYLAKACYATGRFPEAVTLIQAAIAIEQQAFGSESFRLAVSHYNLGLAALELDEELALAEQSLAKANRLFQKHQHGAGLFFTLGAQAKVFAKKKQPIQVAAVMKQLWHLSAASQQWDPPSNMITHGVKPELSYL